MEARESEMRVMAAFWPSAALFFLIWLVYAALYSSETVADTLMPSMLIPNIMQGYWVDLSHARVGIDLLKEQPFYYLETQKYGLVGIYPIGMTLLAAPLQAVFWAVARFMEMEVSVVSRGFAQTRFILEKLTASCLSAAAALFVYGSLLRVVQPRLASVLAGIYILGSSSVSLLSQGLWQQTGVNLLSSIMLFFLLSSRDRPARLHEALFFIAVGLLFSVRPTALLWSFFFTLGYWRLFGRPSLIGVLSGALGALPALVWNITIFGDPIGGYLAITSLNFDWNISEWASRMIPILFSTRKGLLVFNPLLFGVALIWFYRARLEHRVRVIVSLLLCAEVCNLLINATSPNWHGGRGFGPRYMVDSLGLMFVLSAISIAQIRERFPQLTSATITAIALWSIILNIFGAVGDRLGAEALAGLHQRVLMP